MHKNLYTYSIFFSAILTVATNIAQAQSGTCAGMSTGPGASLNGFRPFPANSPWNTDISNAPVDPNSANYINYIGGSTPLRADFGSGLWDNQSIGIPYQIVNASVPGRAVQNTAYPTESDPGPVPLTAHTPIQGYPSPNGTDRHVLVLDSRNCWLYELYNAFHNSTGWTADEIAIWDMSNGEVRPYLWTSANAAGLPLFPGLVRYDEIQAGVINHALIFTVATTQQAFTSPATHFTYGNLDSNAPPMGMRVRLKSDFDISSYPAEDQVILTALKKYGMFVSDNGTSMFVSGAPDARWNNDNLSLLQGVTAANFEVVQLANLYTLNNVPPGPFPTVQSLTATPSSVPAGSPVTLSWSTTNAGYFIVTPKVGPVRGSSVVVYPTKTTTYVLNATNQYGRTTAAVTVTVQ